MLIDFLKIEHNPNDARSILGDSKLGNEETINCIPFTKQLIRLPSQPDETVFKLLADLDEQTDWLTETKRGCLSSLHRQITAQANRLPRIPDHFKGFVQEQIVGTSLYPVIGMSWLTKARWIGHIPDSLAAT